MMLGFLAVLGIGIGAFALWALRAKRRSKARPENNWRNEDFMAREANGTWTEGSTHSKSDSGTGGVSG